MQEKLNVSKAGREHVFLGRDKLKANVGMKVLRQGEPSYYALLDAGVNWYEADCTLDFYLRDGNEITLMITPLNGKTGREAKIALEDFPPDPARLRAHVYLEKENLLAIEVDDLGFGEFRASSRHVWRETIELY